MSKSKTNHQRQKLLKLVRYCLAQRPDEFGLVPENNRYRLKDVLKALAEDGRRVSQGQLKELNFLAAAEGQPAPLDMEAGFIGLRDDPPPQPRRETDPPALLYTHCRTRAYNHVVDKGLTPGRGDWVVLAVDRAMAERLAARQGGDQMIVTVQVGRAMDGGEVFERFGETLYLTPSLPADYLQMPRPPKERPEQAAPKAKKKAQEPRLPDVDELPGTFKLRLPEEKEEQAQKRRTKKREWQKDRRKARRRKRDEF